MNDNGHKKDTHHLKPREAAAHLDNFVLEKGIFSNIFEKDIRRVYIYKKAERLAKAIHLIGPAFLHSPALRNRVDAIAVGLVDGATLPPAAARQALARELLALSSVLSIARTSGLLSSMNAELIAREAHALLDEIATYEEPRLFLEEAPTLASLFKSATSSRGASRPAHAGGGEADPRPAASSSNREVKDSKGQIKDTKDTGRRDTILSVLRSKGPAYIKDISTVVRGVSEKTIQRELSLLIAEGLVRKSGDRRWTTYALV